MKQLEHIKTIDISIEETVPKKSVFIGNMRKIPGLTMWEFNPVEFTLTEAKYKESKTEILSSVLPKSQPQMKYGIIHSLETKEGCVYVQALNKRNAFKHLAKNGHFKKFIKNEYPTRSNKT